MTLNGFFNPRGIAILGASSDPSKLGYAVARNLVESGYLGAVHLVNPKGGALFGHVMVTSVSEIPDPVDLAIVIVPASSAPQAMRELGQRGIRAAILTSGGFREVGPQGAKLEAEVMQVCQEFGLRLIGPNCVGLLDTHLPFDTTFLPLPMPARGELAFLSHSGAFCAAVIDWSRGQGFGFSRLVSLGNQADLTETDLLPIIADDPNTKTICLYLETISNGQLFLEAARRITPHKPIVALKVGRTASGQKAAASHTGALAGSESALNATFEKAGVLRAASAEQLFDWARALSACPLPVGKKIAIVTSAGGPGVIAADALEAEGLTLAPISAETDARLKELLPAAASTHNPVDMLASGSPQQYASCLSVLLSDPAIDGVMVITLPPPSHRAEDIADALIPLIKAATKPVLVAQMGAFLTAAAFEHFTQAGIPVYPFPERAASALGVLARRAEFLATETEPVDQREFPVAPVESLSADDLVAAYGIPTSPLKLAASPDDAARLVADMTFPVVAKIASPDILHKSDIGGVLLNLNSVAEVVSAYATLMERAQAARPHARLDGITLQRQIADGQDVIIGCVRDPQFGPLMMFGSGGIEAEGLKDVAFALAPLNQAQAEKMIQKTWAGQKLAGFRSIPPVDKSAVIQALIRLSWLAVEHPEISEIEINPLRALAQGAVAVDTRLKI
ncbi:MAG: acetate--CoA ligase family protein [Chloroflexi bacterium]|nr:acetate--CoA ligase family protein [Chloroflexota bacterium]